MFEQGEGGGCVGISPLGSLGNMTHYSTLSALQREREGGRGRGWDKLHFLLLCQADHRSAQCGNLEAAVVSHSNQKTPSGHQTELHHVYLAVLLGAA